MVPFSSVSFLFVSMAINVISGQEVQYGVDCSFPIHSKEFRCGNILGDQKKKYDDFMDGCRKYYGDKGNRCDDTEDERIEMSIRQPQSMINYTSTGYTKIKAPKEVFDVLSSFWETNQHNTKNETWAVGYTYTNHWESPTFLVSVEDTTLLGGGFALKSKIWDAAKSTLEQWTGMEQKPTSLYGIRIYTEGAILSPHVDRLPLVSSCIVNVAQDVDELWPLEVIDREGRAVNITMEPGDMVLYESGSLIHARPFPLKGRYFANVFIHFEPTGRLLGETNDNHLETMHPFFPPYLLPNSPESSNWAKSNPGGWSKPVPSSPIQQAHSPEAHVAAATGDIDRLKTVTVQNKRALSTLDKNGWQPIHEAARFGHLDILQYLIDEMGVDKDSRIGWMTGASPLNVALAYNGPHHASSIYLTQIGAKNIAEDNNEL
jgi:prolyl 4-hydroxylase